MVDDLILHNDWHVVARSQDLQKGTVKKTRLLAEDLVLWRCGDEALAWQDLCPHRGVSLALGSVEGDTLVCPYHGLAFNNTGQCVRIPTQPDQPPPARASVRTYQTQERYGLVWVCLGKPEQDVPPFPEWDDPTTYRRRIFGGPYHYRASGQRAIENLLDVAHLPFVHGGILGDRSRAVIDDYQVELHPDGITFEVGVLQADSQGSGQEVLNTFSYGVLRPLTTYFRKGPSSSRLTLFLTVTPVEEVECIAWGWIVMNYAYDAPEATFKDFFDKVMAEDISIVESQRPQRLPLDLQAEFHLSCDGASIAYRKGLKQLGVTFGTTKPRLRAPVFLTGG